MEAGSDADEIGQTIVNTLARVNGGGEYVSNNLVKQKDGLLKLMDIVTLVLSAVGAISLLVASLSIMTVMLVSVNERTREIGIKKSIGAKRSTILLEFLLEAVLISIIGCGIGVIIGNWNLLCRRFLIRNHLVTSSGCYGIGGSFFLAHRYYFWSLSCCQSVGNEAGRRFTSRLKNRFAYSFSLVSFFFT